MITPSFSLTATERVLPKLALDFTTASLDSRITFARSGDTATVTNSSGVITAINANLPRFDFNPTTLVCRGLLIEEARTNLLLNSLINGTNLTTQIVITTAVSTTLSFYGTGQIVLTGTSSATVVGTGAYPSRTTLTFTPTAGALTLTVTGTVQYAQLEVGAFVTSFIPTAGVTVTRNADLATMTGTNFSSWFNASQGTFSVRCSQYANKYLLQIDDGTGNNRIQLSCGGANAYEYYTVANGGVTNAFSGSSLPATQNTMTTISAAYKAGSNNAGIAGQLPFINQAGAIPSGLTTLRFAANQLSGQQGSCYIQRLFFYPQRLINAELQAFSK